MYSFFLPTHKEQQLFFELIQKNSIVNYYEENEQMMLYGYIIYESYYKIKKCLIWTEKIIFYIMMKLCFQKKPIKIVGCI